MVRIAVSFIYCSRGRLQCLWRGRQTGIDQIEAQQIRVQAGGVFGKRGVER